MVKDFMTTKVICANANTTVEQAAKLMLKHHISCLPVHDEQMRLIGILTESDFVGREYNPKHALTSLKTLFGEVAYLMDVEEVYKKSKSKKLSEVMSKDVKTITPADSLSFVVAFMHSNNLKRIPVVDNEKIVGLVTRQDLLKAFDSL